MTPLRLAAALGTALALGSATSCGGAQRPADPEPAAAAPAPTAAASDPRTPLERRRDAACDQLAPRITACAVEDARADLAAGKIDQRQFARDTAPEVQHKNTEQFLTACKRARYSSRQVRVLEVCPREEAQCGPLVDCLGHLGDRAPDGGK
ncbi:MAG TPA: hypothetical protein VK601_20940 [Kofleriaceae bacterium]|nr:hypothetical protein [Kofleriaceae bacterium]